MLTANILKLKKNSGTKMGSGSRIKFRVTNLLAFGFGFSRFPFDYTIIILFLFWAVDIGIGKPYDEPDER